MRSVMLTCLIKARDKRQRTLREEEGAGALESALAAVLTTATLVAAVAAWVVDIPAAAEAALNAVI